MIPKNKETTPWKTTFLLWFATNYLSIIIELHVPLFEMMTEIKHQLLLEPNSKFMLHV